MEASGAPYYFEQFSVDPVSRTVSRGSERIALTPKEFSTLLYLLQHAGAAVAREALISAVWPDTVVGDTSLGRNISVLRRHFGAGCIQAVPKFGYRFECPVSRRPPLTDNRDHLADSSARASTPPAGADGSPFWKRIASWLKLAAVLLLVSLIAGGGWARQRPRSADVLTMQATTPAHVPSEAAHRLFMTGTFELERRTIQGYRQAAEAFSAATESDPKYAEAYVGLSEAYLFMAGIVAETECFPKARAAAETAFRLDPANAGAHRNLAYLLLNDRPDLERSEQEYKLALKLDPHDARAHHWYAQLLAAERKTAESVREASRGYELDPASVSSGANYAFMLTQNNQSVEAERLLSKLLEREPNNDMAWGYLGFAKLKSGQYRESAHAFRVAAGMGTLKVNYLACAGYAMARAGDPSEAMAVLRMIHDRKQKGEWVPAQSMVMLELALGNREQALSWIERGTSDHSTTLFEVATDPIYSELHDEPAYPNLSRQLGSSH